MIIFKCDRCGEEMSAPTEYEAEVLFSNHECEGMRNLRLMSQDLLLKIINGQITEDEAWAIQDAKSHA